MGSAGDKLHHRHRQGGGTRFRLSLEFPSVQADRLGRTICSFTAHRQDEVCVFLRELLRICAARLSLAPTFFTPEDAPRTTSPPHRRLRIEISVLRSQLNPDRVSVPGTTWPTVPQRCGRVDGERPQLHRVIRNCPAKLRGCMATSELLFFALVIALFIPASIVIRRSRRAGIGLKGTEAHGVVRPLASINHQAPVSQPCRSIMQFHQYRFHLILFSSILVSFSATRLFEKMKRSRFFSLSALCLFACMLLGVMATKPPGAGRGPPIGSWSIKANQWSIGRADSTAASWSTGRQLVRTCSGLPRQGEVLDLQYPMPLSPGYRDVVYITIHHFGDGETSTSGN